MQRRPGTGYRTRARRQAGATAVEFALISMLFFSLLLGVLEFGYGLYLWNSAVEATRLGARVAVVCDPNSSSLVLQKMRGILPSLQATQVGVSYFPAGCNIDTCQRVEVKVMNISLTPRIPLLDVTLTMPPFATTLPRESLDSAGGANPACT